MALNFPSTPTINQVHTDAGKSWRWTGTSWAANTDVFSSGIVAVAGTDIDCSLGNYFTKTIAANTTFTFSNSPATKAYSFVFEVLHTSGTITWPASVRWPQNTPPTLATGKSHLFVFVSDNGGSTWYGAFNVDYTT